LPLRQIAAELVGLLVATFGVLAELRCELLDGDFGVGLEDWRAQASGPGRSFAAASISCCKDVRSDLFVIVFPSCLSTDEAALGDPIRGGDPGPAAAAAAESRRITLWFCGL